MTLTSVATVNKITIDSLFYSAVKNTLANTRTRSSPCVYKYFAKRVMGH